MRGLALGPLLLAAACSGYAAPARCPGCDVLVIGVDDLRWDRVGALGAPASRTPRLDAWAGRAFRFSNAVSAAPWTLPSFASILTGQYPRRHGLTNRFDVSRSSGGAMAPARLPSSLRTLASALKARGYRTAAFTGGAAVSAEFGFDAGFDVFDGTAPFAGFARTAPAALAWLARTPGPRFVFLHGYDIHAQHRGPRSDPAWQELRRRSIDGETLDLTRRQRAGLARAYDDAVSAADARLGAFLASVSSGAVVVVVADHGEELGEHGGVDHGLTLYDELIHVPLLVYVPGAEGRLIAEQVRTVDVLPTILEVVEAPPGEPTDGESLAPLMAGVSRPGRDARSETDFLYRRSLSSLRRADGWKLVRDNASLDGELYDLRVDPGETKDVSLKERAVLLELSDAMGPR